MYIQTHSDNISKIPVLIKLLHMSLMFYMISLNS